LRDTARFASFVAGRNGEVVELLKAGSSAPRVLWLWGPAGSGKTHLLQAACAFVGEQGGAATYLDLAAGPDPAWLEGCETLDFVGLDNLETVALDAAWNRALFRLHALLQDASGRLCVATTVPPAQLRLELPDLRSRLLAGSVHQMRDLAETEQVEVLRRRARQRGLELTEEAALYLLHRLPRDMHSLCSVLDRLDDASLAAQRRLTVPFLRAVLESQGPGIA
jgi:DnaA family protein